MFLHIVMFVCSMNIAYGTMERVGDGGFITREEFESALNKLDSKIASMQEYIVNLEESRVTQRQLNEFLSRQVMELRNENAETKNRLSKLQVVCNRELLSDIINTSKHTRPPYISGSEMPDDKEAYPVKIETAHNHTDQGETFAFFKAALRNRRLSPTALRYNGAPTSHHIQERQTTGSVAFSVFVKNDITNLGTNQVIKYDGAMVNDGNGYDFNTGIFTVPTGGLYLFSITVEDYHDQDLWVVLLEDGFRRSMAVAEPYAESQNIMGENIVLLHVSAGSKLWVAIDKGNRIQADWSTFSGVLLH